MQVLSDHRTGFDNTDKVFKTIGYGSALILALVPASAVSRIANIGQYASYLRLVPWIAFSAIDLSKLARESGGELGSTTKTFGEKATWAGKRATSMFGRNTTLLDLCVVSAIGLSLMTKFSSAARLAQFAKYAGLAAGTMIVIFDATAIAVKVAKIDTNRGEKRDLLSIIDAGADLVASGSDAFIPGFDPIVRGAAGTVSAIAHLAVNASKG